MKSLQLRLTIVALLFLTFTFSKSFSQNMSPDVPGPQVTPKNSDKIEMHQQQDMPSNQQELQRDEYGAFNFNASLSLGTTGGYMAVSNPNNENVDGSVEAWIYPTTLTSTPVIISKGDATNVGFLFGISSSSGNKLFIRFGNGVSINTSGSAIPLNTWTHVACTWNGGAGSYTVSFYINGALSGSTSPNTGSWNITSDSLTVGKSRAFSGTNFLGSIDEVRYWTDLRTATEIRDNRFVGLGDGTGANTGSALTSSSHYAGLNDSWNFNVGGTVIPDDIGGHTGYLRSCGCVYSSFAPQPMPYNFALRCSFGANDYVTVPDNSAFNQNADGTVEAWVYPTGQTTTHMIISRGTTGFDFFWGVRQSIGNKQVVDIGNAQFQNSDGVVIPLNKWTHVAAKWTSSGGNFTVTFYVNGHQSGSPVTLAATWTSLSGTLRIGGWHGGTANNFNGYLDEVRYWQPAMTEDQIRANMFASGRTLLPNSNLLAVWNFDGNLLNRGTTTGIDGSFNTGGTNNCYISGFRNETSTGALSNSFIAHATVVNQLLSAGPYPFPSAYVVRVPANKHIADNTSVFDTIHVNGSAALTSINVFMAIRHTFCGDLSITLKAPNGQTRDLSSGNGGTGEDLLTFFGDGSTPVTTAGFYPPFSNVAGPEASMGNFGGTNVQGNWILEVHDGAAGDTGDLIGWGLRFNNGITNIEPVSNNIPKVYSLYQNYPNPFNPVTSIKFDIPQANQVKLVVYDILGREVKTLVNEFKNPGQYELSFDASNFASGTYFYRIEAGDFVQVKKMVLVK